MKRFTKACGLIALICILGGAIGIGAIVFAKGDKLFTELGQATDGTILRFGGLDRIWTRIEKGTKIRESEDGTEQEILTDASIEKRNLGHAFDSIELNLGGCEFDTKDSEDENYYFSMNNNRRCRVETEGNTLVIDMESEIITTNYKTAKITLFVPKNSKLESFTMNLGAGEMNYDSLQAKKVTVDLGAGKVNFRKLTAEEVLVDVGAGDVEIKDAAVDTLNLNLGAGGFEYAGSIAKEIEAEVSMGGAVFKLDGAADDFNYDLDVSLGEISVDGKEYHGSTTLSNHASKKIEASCAMGSIEFKF